MFLALGKRAVMSLPGAEKMTELFNEVTTGLKKTDTPPHTLKKILPQTPQQQCTKSLNSSNKNPIWVSTKGLEVSDIKLQIPHDVAQTN